MISHLVQLAFHQHISKLIGCLNSPYWFLETWRNHLYGKFSRIDLEWVVGSCGECEREGVGNRKRAVSEATDRFIRIQDGATQLEIHFSYNFNYGKSITIISAKVLDKEVSKQIWTKGRVFVYGRINSHRSQDFIDFDLSKYQYTINQRASNL